MPRVRPCVTLINLGEQRAIRRHTGVALLDVCCDVALNVAFGQAPGHADGRGGGPLGLLFPGLRSKLGQSKVLLQTLDLLEHVGVGTVCGRCVDALAAWYASILQQQGSKAGAGILLYYSSKAVRRARVYCYTIAARQ
jgi:bacterioferritin-associated ferredoxin